MSIRPVGQEKYGTRTEVKNMNSIRGVERAIAYEIERQTKLVESGGQVQQQTLLWDEKAQSAHPMRRKRNLPTTATSRSGPSPAGFDAC
jgi:aspartyl-tRNA(Asn)/glutamyl-tRNA(Gln) amidotransferase subunit B